MPSGVTWANPASMELRGMRTLSNRMTERIRRVRCLRTHRHGTGIRLTAVIVGRERRMGLCTDVAYCYPRQGLMRIFVPSTASGVFPRFRMNDINGTIRSTLTANFQSQLLQWALHQ